MAKLFLYFKVKELPQVNVVSFIGGLPAQIFLPLYSDLHDWGMKDVCCKMNSEEKTVLHIYITILITWVYIYYYRTCIN